MSYATATATSADRVKALATVIGIHALLGAGIVAGLAVTTIIVEPEDKPFIGDEVVVPIEPIDPEPTRVIEDPIPQPRNDPFVPPTPFPFPDPSPLDSTQDMPDDGPVIANPGPEPAPSPSPRATVTPTPSPSPTISAISARPTNGPAGWITTDDYPQRDLRRGNEGTGSYRLTIGTNGRVSDCQMTASTGHRGLDRQTCRVIQRRARFDAATDTTGSRVTGSYTGTVTWQIPE